jgi:glycosyltransferase involved in cell wall biosynthesis
MKLIVVIPAYNEEKTIPLVIKSVPRKIAGIDAVKVLVYSDGSTDKTVEKAKKAKADYVFSHKKNLGLARTFRDAVEEAVKLKADIIVNTDADNQYDQRQIKQLIKPILEGKADLVSGNRQITKLSHMPLGKKYGNLLGSLFIRFLTGSSIQDASSGFRAMTRELVQKVRIFSDHTYTHEMLIAAHFYGFTIAEIPITFNRRAVGKSRLISGGIFNHILKSGATIIRSILLYRALAVFSFLGGLMSFLGLLGVCRFLFFAFVQQDPAGHVQSLVISSILLGIGFNIIVLGFVADLISYNRKLIEDKQL